MKKRKGRQDQQQQGDVLFKKVTRIPAGVKQNSCFILRSGEHTGHHHAIDTEEAIRSGAKVFDTEDGLKFLEIEEPVTVKHPEHGAVTLPPGIWQIGAVQEYNYFEEMSRLVRD